MTRDEAIKIEVKKLKVYNYLEDATFNRIAAANVDALIELGLLKVDEPASAKIMDISTFEDGRMIVYQNSNKSFDVWYHGRMVWSSKDTKYDDDMVKRELALLRKLNAAEFSPNDLHNYCKSVGIGLVKIND